MRRHVVLALLVLILAVGLYSPVNLAPSSMSPAIGIESPFETFTAAVDGAESDQSINSFSSTLNDDVLFFPDRMSNSTIDYIDAGAGKVEILDYTETFVLDASSHIGQDTYYAWLRENWTVHDPGIDGFNYAFYCVGGANDDDAELWIYDFVADDWVKLDDDIGTSLGWSNGTVTSSDYWDLTNNVIMFMLNSTDADSTAQVYNDYSEITFYHMTLSDADHYAESFADVSDWAVSIGNTPTTDGDVMNWVVPGDDSNDKIYTNAPSLSETLGYYYEFRIWANTTVGTVPWALYRYPADGAASGGVVLYGGSDLSTTPTTFRDIHKTAGATESICLIVKSTSAPVTIYVDYLRIGPADEMGWAHDGSTTAGVTDDGSADWTYGTSSDDDVLTLTFNKTGAGADSWGSIYLNYDTTTTAADIESDYYPFFESYFRITAINAPQFRIFAHLDGHYSYSGTYDATSSWGYNRFNQKVVSGSSTKKCIEFQVCTTTQYQGATIEIDWTQAFSIANHTVTQSGAGTDDYLYVDSGVLYSSIDDGYIELNHDPALSVSDTYSVYNLTTSSTAPQFSQYVSAWSSYSDETRGATTSGTVTDIKLKFDSTEILSAIKFIEDGTAPTVIRSFATPDPADDDETVTLSAVVEDSVLVYEVNFNAITYPVGFSDVDYSATESTDNLWTYSFSTLTAGYYCFKILGSDGANLNVLTEYGYISLSVREAAININPITFVGAGDDFEDVTLSFECNRDGSYSITEWVLADGSDAAETWTGTVIDGWNNIAWDKLTTTSNTVYFNFTITSGALSWVFENQYQVAQKTFDVVLSDKTVTFDWVCLEGESTKAAAYAVYDINNVLRSSGTIPEGSWALSFEIWNKKSLTETFYGVKFTNGSSTDWINGTYYPDNPEEYKGGGVVTAPPWWQDPMTWVIIGGGLALVYIATSGQKVGKLPNAPKDLK